MKLAISLGLRCALLNAKSELCISSGGKESFLFTRSKIGAGLLGIFCFAVKYNVCKQLHKQLPYLLLFRVVPLALCMILPESEQSMELVYSHIRFFKPGA